VAHDLEVLTRRLARTTAATAAHELDALLITPGPNLTYLTGYHALPLERLTCLVVPAEGQPTLVVPRLELAAAGASSVKDLPVTITGWDEADSAYELVAATLSSDAAVGVDDAMPARHLLRFQQAMPKATQRLASTVLRELRMRKDDAEIAALGEAGAAIDRVHLRMWEWLRPGRTEREIGDDIANAILEEGHATVDFVIVGSGPNGASPHHERSDRIIQSGEPVVIDIGGTMPSGYCSDATRMYCIGDPPADFVEYFAVLLDAQQAAVQAVAPGMTPRAIDAVARDRISAAGLGERFFHRTGHGIGLETHEEPYIVAGNEEPVDVGMTFSIEPGIYFEGKHGARIEDIVVVTEDGVRSFNHAPHEVVVL